MAAPGAIANAGLRTALAAALLTAAGAGCTGVTIEPADVGWTVSGEDDASRATWTAGDVHVVVPLEYEGDATHVTADVLNDGPSVARLTFAAPGGTTAALPLGRVSGEPPSFERPWSESVYPNRPVEVPAGAPGRPGAVRLSLLPDARWGPDDPPPLGSTVTLDIGVAAGSETAHCSFRFRVTVTPEDGWSGLGRAGRWAVVVLLAAVAVAAGIWWA